MFPAVVQETMINAMIRERHDQPLVIFSPRRFGKTTAVHMFVVVYAQSCAGGHVVVHGLKMDLLVALLNEAHCSFRVVRNGVNVIKDNRIYSTIRAFGSTCPLHATVCVFDEPGIIDLLDDKMTSCPATTRVILIGTPLDSSPVWTSLCQGEGVIVVPR